MYKLFWYTAENTDNFDSDNRDGEVDGGRRCFGGLYNAEAHQAAETLMPLAMSAIAELYKLFWDSTHGVITGLITESGFCCPATPVDDAYVKLYGPNSNNLFVATLTKPNGTYVFQTFLMETIVLKS